MPVKKNAKSKASGGRKVRVNKDLKKLEKDIVKKQGKMTEAQFEAEERKILEDRRNNVKGMGIEKEEEAGEEPYPEIAEALKDSDESEEEE
ncbi:MAG: hypothetical protein HY833_02355 [Candidatus Aenigmarchaeota archaeon]|nr:hypothetical protein [Candidatus Aenigmarchaeota archaeon]